MASKSVTLLYFSFFSMITAWAEGSECGNKERGRVFWGHYTSTIPR